MSTDFSSETMETREVTQYYLSGERKGLLTKNFLSSEMKVK